jgi:hypothetical protein
MDVDKRRTNVIRGALFARSSGLSFLICIAFVILNKTASDRTVTSMHVSHSNTHYSAWQGSSSAQLDAWKSNLFVRTMTLYREVEHASGASTEPIGSRRFDLFSPFIECPDRQEPTRFGGQGDGSKLVCQGMLKSSDCVVYSLGSHNNYRFEQDILDKTNCTVVTFDCTIDGRKLGPRHVFSKMCLGSQLKMEEDPQTWTTLSAAMKRFKHTRLDLLKIDIEGAEYDVLGEWGQSSSDLPRQLAIEIHYSGIYYGTPSFKNSTDASNLLWPLHEMRTSDLALFLFHLANAGYGIVSREDNPRAQHCTELSLIRLTR